VGERQSTVVTADRGRLSSRRVVRGREAALEPAPRLSADQLAQKKRSA
jgi:hypothetical protein